MSRSQTERSRGIPEALTETPNSAGLQYVLITPARNEEEHIEQTIQSVIGQTVLPKKWVIVSDGSTDRTDEIVQEYLGRHSWMELLQLPLRRDRDFAAKVECFNSGFQRVQDIDSEIVGNLDADITFEGDYFEFLLQKFKEDPKLGVAGTPFVEGNASYDFRYASQEHVSGACQLFRRKCFGEIGGYTPVKGGGIDWIAVTTARMKGWRTRTFVEKVCHHRRPMGTASSSHWQAWYRLGKQEYYLGGHPLWQFFRACFQIRNKPYLIGGVLLLAGYSWSALTRVQRPIPANLMEFHRREQMQRLRQILEGIVKGGRSRAFQGGSDEQG